MGVGKKVLLVLVILIVLIAGLGYYFLYSDPVIKAFLTIESGSAQVDKGSGWEAAVDDMKLSKNDKIKVIDGLSVVTLHESVIIELEAGTEVSIASLTKKKLELKQDSGSTWNKFTRVTGVDGYEVETPTSVATMRGTEFGVDYFPETGDTVQIVGEGTVEMTSNGESITLNGLEKGSDADGLDKVALTQEDRARIKVQATKTLQRLKGLRKLLINNQNAVVKGLIKKYVGTEEELDKYLADIDAGVIDDSEIVAKAPIHPPALDRFVKLNSEIKEQQQFIASL